MEEKTQYKSQSLFRYYIVEDKRIGTIRFYNNNKILFSTSSGWLEDEGKDLLSVWINKANNANKVNLNRKDNFIIKEQNTDKTWQNEKEYILYINTELENITISETKSTYYYDDETETVFKLYKNINGLKYTVREYNADTKEWQVVEKTESINHVYTYESRLKPYGQKIKESVEYLKTHGQETGKYELQKTIETYNKIKHIIERKEEV